ncbi:hypothetical protein MLD38_035722 [Melastoma candidum]|uniref:Uncharacterized protein n=1 Tax=Melastoma candidum TaxID=119954 RepID=A0ACB9LHE6_9MYRT|nr:hypothetical protein MLD38_035722 [Melastoma candidum]
MADADAISSGDSVAVESILRRVKELSDAHIGCLEDISSSVEHPSSEDVLHLCVMEIERGIRDLVPEQSVLGDIGPDDFDTIRGHLEEELNAIDLEKAQLSEAMKDLSNSILADSNAIDKKLEALEFSLEPLTSQAFEGESDWAGIPWNFSNVEMSQKFEILELQSQIEKKEIVLYSLQHIDGDLMKCDAIEKIEDALSDVKIVDIYGNSIRLSLSTYMPKFWGSIVNAEDIADTLKVDHEILIEFGDGNVGLSSVVIFPNDVFIGDIVDTAMSLRWNTRQSPLEWLVRKTQDQIRLATLRRLAAKNASNARYSAEYMDREGTVAVHMPSGVDMVIKVSHDWPLSDSSLTLTSIKVSDSCSRRVSDNHFTKVQVAANSLDAQRRRSLSTFLEEIDKMLQKGIQ